MLDFDMSDNELTLKMLIQNPKYVEIIERALEIEPDEPGPPWREGWKYDDIPADPRTLGAMCRRGILNKVQERANHPNRYKLSDTERCLELLVKL